MSDTRLKSGYTPEQWKARAEWAEERLRHVAATLRIPDGARYLNDVREHAELADKTRADRDRYKAALERYANESPDWLKSIAREALGA